MTESMLWNEIGTIYQKMGMLDDSIQAFQRAVEQCSGSDSAQFISNLASSYLLKNEYGRAISLLKKGLPHLKTGREQAAAWNKIGDAYRALKDLDNAIIAYHKADELEMQTAPLQITPATDQNLAAALEETKSLVAPREQPAVENSKIALVMTNTTLESSASAGIRPPSSKDFSFITNGASQASTATPPMSSVEDTLPSRLPKSAPAPTGSPSSGEKPSTAESPKVDPSLEEILSKINVYEKITQINPSNHRALDTLGKLYKSIGRYQDAISAYQRAIEFAPQIEHYHYYLGLLFAVEQKPEDAIRAFENVLQINPDYILAHSAMAGIYRRLGIESKANQHVSAALPKMNNESAYNRACFYAICGDPELSIEFLRVALQNNDAAVEWVKTDPDLDAIRTDERYKQLILEMEKPSPSSPNENYYSSELKNTKNQLLTVLNSSVAR